MISQQNIERLARAVGRRLAAPPSDAVRERHLDAITQAVAHTEPATAQLSFGRRQAARITSRLARSRRLVPAFAAVAVLVALVATPLLRGPGNDLPILSAAPPSDGPAPTAGEALMERGSDMADAIPDIMWWPIRHHFSLADGVTAPAGTASAWRLSVDGSFADRANELAAVFGLPAAQPSEWDRDVLIATGAEQASVTLYPSGEWYYANFTAYPQWSCPSEGEASTSSDGVTTPSLPEESDISEPSLRDEPDGCTPPPPATQLPSTADARQQAAGLLARLGITDVTFETPYRDRWTVSLWGMQNFADLPDYHGQSVSVTLGNDGEILSAYGTLARPVLLGEYPTVSADEAVERLNAQFDDNGSGDWARPLPSIDTTDRASPDIGIPNGETELEVHDITLVAVTIVPSAVWTEEGFTVIAPHYRFTDSDGYDWWIPAVADRYLAG